MPYYWVAHDSCFPEKMPVSRHLVKKLSMKLVPGFVQLLQGHVGQLQVGHATQVLRFISAVVAEVDEEWQTGKALLVLTTRPADSPTPMKIYRRNFSSSQYGGFAWMNAWLAYSYVGTFGILQPDRNPSKAPCCCDAKIHCSPRSDARPRRVLYARQ